MQFYKVAVGLRGPWLASVTAGTQGKPRAWPMVGIDRNLTSRLGWVAPGKPMLDQAGNEPLLIWLWHLLPWAGLRRTSHNGFCREPTDWQDGNASQMPLLQAQTLLILPAEGGGRRPLTPHMGTLQFALGPHVGIVSAAPGGRESGDFHFSF